jgi:hypothetical protein
LVLVLGFTAFAVWLIPKLYRLAKRGFHALRARFRGEPLARHTAETSVAAPPV